LRGIGAVGKSQQMARFWIWLFTIGWKILWDEAIIWQNRSPEFIKRCATFTVRSSLSTIIRKCGYARKAAYSGFPVDFAPVSLNVSMDPWDRSDNRMRASCSHWIHSNIPQRKQRPEYISIFHQRIFNICKQSGIANELHLKYSAIFAMSFVCIIRCIEFFLAFVGFSYRTAKRFSQESSRQGILLNWEIVLVAR
jgi:hypothetical protein